MFGPSRPSQTPFPPPRSKAKRLRLVSAILFYLVVCRLPDLAGQSEGSPIALFPGSTRAAGLGGAGAALVGDAGAIFDNPAGIAAIRHVAVEGSYEPYLAGTTFSSAAVATRAGRLRCEGEHVAIHDPEGAEWPVSPVKPAWFRGGRRKKHHEFVSGLRHPPLR